MDQGKNIATCIGQKEQFQKGACGPEKRDVSQSAPVAVAF
jgi:hypothetical protein